MKAPYPKISVITASYNQGHRIEETFKNVQQQNYPNLEYIVIDGASTDNTLDIIKKYETFISIWISEPDTGVYNAMNKGIAMATGDLIYFLNVGDSFYSDNVLLKAGEFALKYNTADLLYGDAWLLYNTGKVEKRETAYLSKINLFQKMICHQTIFAKRRLFLENGGFDEQYKIKADYEWLLRNIFKGATHKYIDLDVCYYEVEGMSAFGYSKISVFESPKIVEKYFSPLAFKFITRFILNTKVTGITTSHLRSKLFLSLCDKLIH
ncbi:glycosyltransferase family 2 protein [Pontibacter beigongshangensis]|uniref:glycosyltransferase family 2 protein n=1 Tax=Pontibacter beigongshangensis TaxID=2574733 RepID=UPI0016503662|nr:glycosyltransferase family 2 protein [Pontibacter beigongshangensis]